MMDGHRSEKAPVEESPSITDAGPAQPTPGWPPSAQPASNQPASNRPASNQPASNQPASNQPASGQPTSLEHLAPADEAAAPKGVRTWRPTEPLATTETPTSRGGILGALSQVARKAKRRVDEQLDSDRFLQTSMSATIELAASRYALDPGAQWKRGEPLQLLLAGYSGTRNTGADVRVEEMIRQLRHLIGDEHLDLSILTIDPQLTRGYFRTVKQLHVPKIFPRFLFDVVHRHHGVIACEGSMFKSKFANALSTMMVGALGLAAAEQKIAIGYGGEAGKMDPPLERLVRRYCRDALIVTRNESSRKVLAGLGVTSKPGTDTAWAFEPASDAVGQALLRGRGWDGMTPILALCPINPFWWPVKPDLGRALLQRFDAIDDRDHYGSIYFHRSGSDVDEAQRRYLNAWAGAVRRFRLRHDVFIVLFGSEQLDRPACEDLDRALGGGHPIIVSDEHDMYEMVSAMRQSAYMLSSRYHAIVMTMAAGVVSAGVTMDERIRNLMADREQKHLSLEAEARSLEQQIEETLETLVRDAEPIRQGIDRCLKQNLERMGKMGMVVIDHLRQRHPDLPLRSELGSHGDPWDHLPPLPPLISERLR